MTEIAKNIDTGSFDFAVSAAGRVNIIGEHIDYCGGKVFPAALSLKNTVYIRRNGTDRINLAWTTLDRKVTLEIARLGEYRDIGYGNYQAGSLYVWKRSGHPVVGCDILSDCTVPFGSGLSSSAAIEVSTIAAMCAATGTPIDEVAIALAAQTAEREYVGVNCGIMDQYASACGRAGMAMLLDCGTLDCEYVPLQTGDCSLVIIDCKKPHSLNDSKYNERRAQTEEALAILRPSTGISCLAELTEAQLETHGGALSEVLYRRAAHVVGECARVAAATDAMRRGDMKKLGEILTASHVSLRDLYEVTGREPDALAEAAWRHPDCLGSRMTGGGFGGCTVSLVKTSSVEDFKAFVLERYKAATGYAAAAYEATVSDGIVVNKIRK